MSNSPICVDANLVIRLVADPDDELVRSTWDQWDAKPRHVAAPTLPFYKVSNPLYRYGHTGKMNGQALRLAQRDALSLPWLLEDEVAPPSEAARSG